MKFEADLTLPFKEAKRRLLQSFIAAYTADVLKRAEGNITEAAILAELDRGNFNRLRRGLRK